MTDESARMTLLVEGEPAMEALGAVLARAQPTGLIFLEGDLGAGKTTLSRGILRGLGHSGAVKSPTYTLVEPYRLDAGPVFHFDLYRLGDPEELEFMGFRDYLSADALCLVEWPERGGDLLPTPDLRVRLSVEKAGRRLVIMAGTESGRTALTRLESWQGTSITTS